MFDSNSVGEVNRPVSTKHNLVTPMRGEVFFEQIKEENASGIILPTGYRTTNDTLHGRITNVGRDSDGLKVGDYIIASKHHAYQIDFQDKQVFKIGKNDILAVCEE